MGSFDIICRPTTYNFKEQINKKYIYKGLRGVTLYSLDRNINVNYRVLLKNPKALNACNIEMSSPE